LFHSGREPVIEEDFRFGMVSGNVHDEEICVLVVIDPKEDIVLLINCS
jgi:hypothetical protein